MAFESSETQREEILLTGSLQKMHAQLRRLRNDSSILKDASITAIPHNKSKVFFEYINIPKLSSFRANTPVDGEDAGVKSKRIYEPGQLKVGSFGKEAENAGKTIEDAKLGFNMCECGFEGISVKIAKRSSNHEECSESQRSPNEHEDTFHSEDEENENTSKVPECTVVNIEEDKSAKLHESEVTGRSTIETEPNQSKQNDKKVQTQHVPKRGEESVNNYNRHKASDTILDDNLNTSQLDGADSKPDPTGITTNERKTDEGEGSTPEIKNNEHEECRDPTECSHGPGGKHSSSSGSVELKTSWFNFAAPPKTPISRKIEFSKMDWNLLSTASPSIDAWFNAVDRLQKNVSASLNQVTTIY